jgi:hypothetical protein
VPLQALRGGRAPLHASRRPRQCQVSRNLIIIIVFRFAEALGVGNFHRRRAAPSTFSLRAFLALGSTFLWRCRRHAVRPLLCDPPSGARNLRHEEGAYLASPFQRPRLRYRRGRSPCATCSPGQGASAARRHSAAVRWTLHQHTNCAPRLCHSWVCKSSQRRGSRPSRSCTKATSSHFCRALHGADAHLRHQGQ